MRTLLLFLICVIGTAQAQEFTVAADLRMRYEHRDGYAMPKRDSASPANFVVQRNRISMNYKKDKLELMFVPQNIRVWGESAVGSTADVNGVQIYQAWLKYKFNPKWSAQVGRQEIERGDARILGNADWNMQGRSHDALFIYFQASPAHLIEAGAALNASRESVFLEPYAIKSQYKNMQYLGYKAEGLHLKWSAMVLNQAWEVEKGKLVYHQTSGLYLTFAKHALILAASGYLQTGRINDKPLNAFQVGGSASLNVKGNWTTGVGFEYLSGNRQGAVSTVQRSFTPWFGTNHKFNGNMDYFYVGNHLNSTGLVDGYGKIMYKKGKIKGSAQPHVFASAASLFRNEKRLNNYLGTEIDLVVHYQLLPDLQVNGGYSKIWITESLLHLKGGNQKGNHWGFISIHCHPEIFSNKR